MPNKTEELRQAIIDGDEETTRRLSEEMLTEGSDPLKTIEECVYPAVASRRTVREGRILPY